MHNDERIRRMKQQGYQIWRIADDLGISTAAVRKSLARTAPSADKIPPNVKAAREMLAEGYDRHKIEQVFGEGVLG